MSHSLDTHAHERREYFPRGLAQPKDGYRFSLDSLLLASFVRLPKQSRETLYGFDFGCGCGVVGLGVLLGNPLARLAITGLDIQEEMVACARQNAMAFGYGEQLDYEEADVSSYRKRGNSAAFVLANPPYRGRDRGRVSPGAGRAAARFEGKGGLVAFCKAATRALRDKAPFFMVHLPQRFPEVVEACQAASLRPSRVRFVHSRADEPARIMLLESRKNGGGDLVVEPPLLLYEGRGEDARITDSALAFCPFLQCNAK